MTQNTPSTFFNNTKILKRDTNYNNLTLFESIHIKQQKYTVNNRPETVNLNCSCDNLIKLHTSNKKNKYKNLTKPSYDKNL